VVNEKASQRHRVILEFGVLIQPLRELKRRSGPPNESEYRTAIAQVRGGDPVWRTHVRDFTTFASDLRFEQEFQDISHVPERLWQAINGLLEGTAVPPGDASAVHAKLITILDAAESRFLELLAKVPVPWQPAMFEANTPFTSYLRIREVIATVRSRLHYFDRYLKPAFFDLFLEGVPRSAQVRLVTTATGAKAVESISQLARVEFADYQLIETSPSHFHDRNLRADNQVFSLGPGVDRAGMALTNFGPAEDSAQAHAQLDRIISLGTVIHCS